MNKIYSSNIKIDQYGSGDCVGCDFDYKFIIGDINK